MGQFAIRSAFLLGAERVIAIDRVPERLQMAKDGGAEILNFETVFLTFLNRLIAQRERKSLQSAIGSFPRNIVALLNAMAIVQRNIVDILNAMESEKDCYPNSR